jgi:putative endonuclease
VNQANRARGRWGEDIAARWYRQRGYEVIARNWRCDLGEVDIIAAGHGWLVFCEVKARASDRFGPGAAAVDAAKQARIHRMARRWLSEQTRRWPRIRFDVASITGVQLEMIEDAF